MKYLSEFIHFRKIHAIIRPLIDEGKIGSAFSMIQAEISSADREFHEKWKAKFRGY